MRTLTKSTLAGFALALSLFGSAAAGPIEDGKAAYDRGDYALAVRLLRPLADQGIAQAQYELGLIYYNGRGIPQDYAQAVGWYRKAADQGYAIAQFNLGLLLELGQGVPQDDAQAVTWYSKAAEQGNANAQLALGMKYALGRGVRRDYVQAHKWLNLAASRFSPGEAQFREQSIEGRDLVASAMTPAQIATAQRLAAEWAAAH